MTIVYTLLALAMAIVAVLLFGLVAIVAAPFMASGALLLLAALFFMRRVDNPARRS